VQPLRGSGRPAVGRAGGGGPFPARSCCDRPGFSPTIPPPPAPGAATECPNGNWTVQLTSLTYANVVLHIQQPPGTDVLALSFGNIDP